MKRILFFAFLCIAFSSLHAKDEMLPTPSELKALQEKDAAQTQELIAKGKLTPIDPKLVKVNIPRLEKGLVYLADEKGKSYTILSPSSVLHGSEGRISWEDAQKLTLNPSFKAFLAKNKKSIVTVNAESKKDGKKVFYSVPKTEFEAAMKNDPKITVVVVDKKTKLPVDGDIRIE